MQLHEYQAKKILRSYGLPLADGRLVTAPEAAAAAMSDLGGGPVHVKAQIHAGGRGLAGGIVEAEDPAAAQASAAALLGQRLVTSQTGPEGQLVQAVYLETSSPAARELYLALLVDRASAQLAFLVSTAGGEAIEAAAATRDGAVLKATVETATGVTDALVGGLATHLDLTGAAADQLATIARGLYAAFLETDASLIEINPLAVGADGSLTMLDVKMTLDDNALYRHPELEALRDDGEEDRVELEARRFEINFASLDGAIGCVVNGAGLGLATLDLLKAHGAAPANFMDIRPVATREQVATGFGLLLDDPKVRAVLVNVYGGGVLRCDTIAEGIALALKKRPSRLPLVVRAAGTNAEICRKVLIGQGLSAQFARDMEEAARLVVAASRKEAA